MDKSIKLRYIGIGESRSVEMRDVRRRATAVRGRSASPMRGSKRRLELAESVGATSKESLSVGTNEIDEMSSVSEKLRKYVFTESNRVSKVASEFLLKCVSEYDQLLMRMMMKNERLEGRIIEYEKRMSEKVNEHANVNAGKAMLV